MNMQGIQEQVKQWAREAGATHVRPFAPEQLRTFDYVRESCAANACGKFGRCWTCPPHLGEPDALEAELQSFAGGVLIQNIVPLEDSWDFEAMTAGADDHNRMMRELRRQLVQEHPAQRFLVLGCGGCGYCDKCSCPDEPCRATEQALASVEGYGLDVKLLVESCGLSYINGQNTVSFVGAVLAR